MRDPPPPIILDLDGVVLQTNFVKHAAMLSLFAADEVRKPEISQYILANGGVRRDRKILHILRVILRHPDADRVLPTLLAAYSAKLDQALLAAPLVPGVAEFLRDPAYRFYLSSSAPEPEIDRQLRSRGLLPCFAAVFGAATPKAQALASIRGEVSPWKPVFFGDSVGDMEAAAAARTPFVAVVCERDNFEGLAVRKLRDFTSATAVRDCILAATRDAA